MLQLVRSILFIAITTVFNPISQAQPELIDVEMQDGSEVEVRIFPADGDTLLLGFACDAGAGAQEEATASSLAKDGIEVWMPDILSSLMLPKLKSSLDQIDSDSISNLIDLAHKTGKKVYLIATGPKADLLLRGAAKWETTKKKNLNGAVLMFPRLNNGAPEPGKEPEYKNAVGTTKLPLLLFEGERTPNRWGVNHLAQALHAGGSKVYTKLIPDVRGYFFKREDANLPEQTVTTQLAGLVKASLFYLQRSSQ